MTASAEISLSIFNYLSIYLSIPLGQLSREYRATGRGWLFVLVWLARPRQLAHDDQRPQGPAGLAERWAAAGGGAPRHCHLLPPPPAAAQAVAAACGCGRGRLEQRRGRRAAAEASRAEPLHSRHTARVRQRRATAQAGAAAGTKRRLALGGDRSRLSGPSGRPRLRSGPPLTRSRPRPSSEPPAPGPPLPVSVGPCLGLLQLPTLLQAYSTTSK